MNFSVFDVFGFNQTVGMGYSAEQEYDPKEMHCHGRKPLIFTHNQKKQKEKCVLCEIRMRPDPA
jgi:hypothetical protein